MADGAVMLADRLAIIPAGNPNRPGYILAGGKAAFITIHETGNRDRGANAAMHARFVAEGGGTEQVSFHFVVDDHESVQLLPVNEVAWHAGDGAWGPGNRTALAIETCVNADGDWQKTLQNLVKLVLRLMLRLGIAASCVVQHNHWSGKNCPQTLRVTGWSSLMNQITAQSAGRRIFPETGHYLEGVFLQKWSSEPRALEYWGYPVRDPEQVAVPGIGTILVQYLQRARFELQPGGAVTLGLVGAELRDRIGS